MIHRELVLGRSPEISFRSMAVRAGLTSNEGCRGSVGCASGSIPILVSQTNGDKQTHEHCRNPDLVLGSQARIGSLRCRILWRGFLGGGAEPPFSSRPP